MNFIQIQTVNEHDHEMKCILELHQKKNPVKMHRTVARKKYTIKQVLDHKINVASGQLPYFPRWGLYLFHRAETHYRKNKECSPLSRQCSQWMGLFHFAQLHCSQWVESFQFAHLHCCSVSRFQRGMHVAIKLQEKEVYIIFISYNLRS